MARKRGKKTVEQSALSPTRNRGQASMEVPLVGGKEDVFRDQEVERQIAAIRAIRDVETEHLLNGLRLLRSNFTEQMQVPVLQFFEENLPNLRVVKNGNDGQYEVQWKDKDSKLLRNQVDERNMHASLLHQLSLVYPDCSAAMPSFGGLESSGKGVTASLLGSDNMQIKDFVREQSETQMLGLQEALQTPGVSSHRLSVGMTPKTLRLPKHGEMLLSVHGSPLGVYKEDSMEAIHESEEG